MATSTRASGKSNDGDAEKSSRTANTLTARQIEDLKQKAAAAGQLRKDVATEQKKTAAAEKDLSKVTKKLETITNQHEGLLEVITSKDRSIKELQALVADLQGILRKNGNVHPSELNRDLMEQTISAAKVYLARTVRWFEDHEDAKHHTRSLIQFLPKGKDSLGGLTEAEYGFMYRQQANLGLQACMQNVQSEAKKAAKGTYKFCLHAILFWVCYTICFC